MTVVLRTTIDSDLPTLFEYQVDPEVVRMAAFPARDRDAFFAHFAKISRDPSVSAQTILADGHIAGSIGSWESDGVRYVGYVLGRAHWGKGIATAALARMLELVPQRPIQAFVAKHNVGSVRVLEKNGFTLVREELSTAHGMVVQELLLTLDGPWTEERKREACLRGPMGRAFLRPDTQVIERPGWHQVLTPSAKGTMNEVVFSQLDASDADRVIDETVASYQAHGLATKWCVGYWTKPDDFGERLTRRGFTSWDVRGMGCASSLALAAPAHVSVEEVTEPTLDEYLTCLQEGWSQPVEERAAEKEVHLATLRAEPPSAFCYLARLDGAVVGTGALALRGGYGYLLGTQVLAAARGRGVYRALVAARLAALRARGLAYAVTQAREATSAPMLEHLGFETLFRSRCYLRACG